LRAILDTSVLLADDIPPLPGELAISAASLADLHFGVLVTAEPATRAERLRRLSILQSRFTALPIGRQPRSRVMDLLIAATAHANSARLYTRNAADLAGLENLIEIVTP
jgi:toxin FitB